MTKAEKMMAKEESNKDIKTLKKAIKEEKKEIKSMQSDIKTVKKARTKSKLGKVSAVWHTAGAAISLATGDVPKAGYHGAMAAVSTVGVVSQKHKEKKATERIAKKAQENRRDMNNTTDKFVKKSAKLNNTVQNNQLKRDKSVSL